MRGAGFRPGAAVGWQVGNITHRLETFVISSSELVAWVPCFFTEKRETATVTVTNLHGPPEVGESNPVLLPITEPTASVAFSQINITLASNPVSIVAEPQCFTNCSTA